MDGTTPGTRATPVQLAIEITRHMPACSVRAQLAAEITPCMQRWLPCSLSSRVVPCMCFGSIGGRWTVTQKNEHTRCWAKGKSTMWATLQTHQCAGQKWSQIGHKRAQECAMQKSYAKTKQKRVLAWIQTADLRAKTPMH